MKIFVNILVAITTLSLGSVAVADAKTLVIKGRVVQLDKQNITVESGKERLELAIVEAGSIGAPPTKYIVKPKVGDTVTVYYTKGTARFDPDGFATKIEVKAGSKR